MPRLLAAVVFGLVLAGSGAARAEIGCAPNCDFVHYYGPHDFTYVRPGLYLYPRCGAGGNCSPYLIASARPYYGRITVRRVTRLRSRP
jgi:hypothetical protein